MNTGLLFYLSRKTSLCQKQIARYVMHYDIAVSNVKICAKQSGLRPAMAALLEAHPVVFVVSGCPEAQPAAARPIFETLHIPLNTEGEPKGVLRLNGSKKNGYLVESVNQAIVIFPDNPAELAALLTQACERLNLKFSLSGEPPKESDVDYGTLVEESMSRIQ